jgi:hypothetical protein
MLFFTKKVASFIVMCVFQIWKLFSPHNIMMFGSYCNLIVLHFRSYNSLHCKFMVQFKFTSIKSHEKFALPSSIYRIKDNIFTVK